MRTSFILMKKSFLEKIKTISGFWWIFLGVVIVGIFLRSYNHHDWLRFNADQGRDAEIVSRVVEGMDSLPLLGPQAGGTQFRLGPMFYYFEIISAKIFGNFPDKMAYPDLFTSILCIPLLFFFLRKYFKKNTSLFLSAIFAVSMYAIRYSRFAWNPNSSPFWTILFLFAIHEIVSERNNRKYMWAMLAGVSIGVGVQLHTTLLAILPVTAVLVFGYFSFRKKKVLKYFLVILAVSVLLNIPQLINEYQKGGRNMKLFFYGVKTKDKSETSIWKNMIQGTSCWIQGNTDIISGYEISDVCSFKPSRRAWDTSVFIMGLIFFLGGIILGLKYFFKEKEADQKSFLAVMFIFTGISYLIFLKFAFELSVRFYLPLIFLPFFLLGFWLRFFREKFNVRENIILLIACVPLICSNLYFVQKSFAVLANYGNEGGGDSDVTILREAEEFAHFITEYSNNEKDVHIVGDEYFLQKAYKPIRYLVGRSNIGLKLADKKNPLPSRYFHAIRSNKKDKMLMDANVKIIGYKTYGKFTMLLVQKI
jgi:4-amino-4-deoxy-L-arabinose transferase-like glycosyltransferase